MHPISSRPYGLSLALALAVIGCGDSVSNPADASTPTDAVTPTDVFLPPLPTAPIVIAASASGHDRLFGVTYDPAGRIYAVGVAADGTETTADLRTIVGRFDAAGALDTTYGTNGWASHNIATGTNGETARGIVVQPSGRVVVLATVEHVGATDARDRDLALVRFNANGSLDAGFGADGVVVLDLSAGEVVGTGYVADSAWGLTSYPDGRLVVTGSQKRTGGTDSDFAVLRLSADGARDATFGTNGLATVDINNRNASPRGATVLPDGSVVAAGYMDDGGVVKPVLFKLTPAGALDATFGANGVFAPTVLAATTEAYAAAIQGTSFVTAGYGRNAATESLDWLSLRVRANGTLDTTWGTSGVTRIDVAMFNDSARNALVLPDDRVMLVGGGRPTETNVDGMVAVLTASGQPDTAFAARGFRTWDFGGGADFFWGVALSPDRSRVALAGVRGVATGQTGDDDGVVFVLPAR